MIGWFGRSSGLIFSGFHRYSSKNDVIRIPISTISQFSQPIGFKSVEFCNNGGAKRFYSAGSNQLGLFVKLIQNTQFRMMGWYGRSSRLIFSSFRYSSKNDVIRTPISTTGRISQISQPIGFKSVEFCNNGGAKRFYSGGSKQRGLFVRWIENIQFLCGALVFVIPRVLVGLIQSTEIRRRLLVYAIPGAVLLISCLGIVPHTNRIQFVVIPIKYEKKLAISELHKRKCEFGGKLLPFTHPETLRVLVIVYNLIEALHRDLNIDMPEEGVGKIRIFNRHLEGFKWQVFVVDSPAVNVYCLPGGKLIVYSGLLKYLSSDAEIASIIAHEVAHVVARHWVEKITRLLFIINARFGRWRIVTPDILSEIIKCANLHLGTRMDMELEMEADYIGLMVMASAGYDPRVAPEVIKKLARIETHTHDRDFATCRVEAVSKASVMQKAMNLYRDRDSLHGRNNLYKSQSTNDKLIN